MSYVKTYLYKQVKFTGVDGLLLGAYSVDTVPRVGEIVSLGDGAVRYEVQMVFHQPSANYVECMVIPISIMMRKKLKQYERK